MMGNVDVAVNAVAAAMDEDEYEEEANDDGSGRMGGVDGCTGDTGVDPSREGVRATEIGVFFRCSAGGGFDMVAVAMLVVVVVNGSGCGGCCVSWWDE